MRRKFIQLSFLDRLLPGKLPVGPVSPAANPPRKKPPKGRAAEMAIPGSLGTNRAALGKKASLREDHELKAIWIALRKEYFPERVDLDEYRVYWSRRNQIRTLASCNLEQKRISVARELNFPQHYYWLAPLLFHEMCHAYLDYNVSKRNGKRAWHGKEFRELEMLHPLIPDFNRWIKEGGWLTAVRSCRAKHAHARRKSVRPS